MNMHSLLVLMTIVFVPLAAAEPGQPAQGPFGDGPFVRVQPGVLLGGELKVPEPSATAEGQPSADGQPSAIVIDLRNPYEGTAEELVRVHAAGHQYLNLPMLGFDIETGYLDALATVLEGRDGRPVWLHCASGKRAAVLYGAYRLRQGDELAALESLLAPLLTSESSREALAELAGTAPAADADDPS